jgi:ATPase subunit of ABC transporter with duplicated ATPase domains
MRIALARMLLSPAGQAASSSNGGEAGGGMLLLDEPTNHLDAAAVKWLAGFLGMYT